MIFRYFIKNWFWLGKNFPSVKILQGAKSTHYLHGIISLFNQNPIVFMINHSLVSKDIMSVSNFFYGKDELNNWETVLKTSI